MHFFGCVHLVVAFLPILAVSTPLPHENSVRRSNARGMHHQANDVVPLKAVSRKSRTSKLRPRQSAAPLVSREDGRDFLAPVSIGGQAVYLDIDTGSSNIWAITDGYSCKPGYVCDFGNAISLNNAFTIFENVDFYTNYADGTSATGSLGNTTVHFAGIEISTQTLGLADSVAYNGDGQQSGLIGLGYPIGTTATEGSTQIHYSSTINTIFTDGLAPQPYFAIALSRDSSNSGAGGYLSVGGVPDLSNSQINASSTYATASMELNPGLSSSELSNYLISVDEIAWQGPSESTATTDSTPLTYYVDTGTTLTQVPEADARAINSLFDPPATLNSDGRYIVSCDATPPAFAFIVAGLELPINEADLIWNAGGGYCMSGIQPLSAGNNYGIIADTSLRSLLAVFDWGNQEIHLYSRPLYES